MCPPTTVSVNNNFSSSETSIAVRSANDEAPRRVQVIAGLVIQVLFGNNRLDDMLHQVLVNGLCLNILVVLCRDHDGVYAQGNHGAVYLLVLNHHLGFPIWAHPLAQPRVAHLCQAQAETRGQDMGQRHQRFVLVGGVPKHVALVACANIFVSLVNVDTLCNVWGLLLDGDNDTAIAIINALLRRVVTNFFESISRYLFVVDFGFSCDFTKNHHHASFRTCLACNFRLGIGF
mmetsp:Transcript_10596/g.20081  ORF Transcript_10596/g.20081 Transcript_10596/m.20081 type:complete len:232 (-) Transcript_10596:150-845(-)